MGGFARSVRGAPLRRTAVELLVLSQAEVASFVHPLKPTGEDAMKYDLLVISGGMLAVGIVIWGFLGNPSHVPRMHAAQEMKADPNLKLISEQSPYMRTER